MKNIFQKASLLLALSMVLVSCEDFLTPVNTDAVDASRAFENIEGARSALGGAYLSFTSTSVISNSSILADNIKLGDGNTGGGVFVHAWAYTPGQGNLIWSSRYGLIFRCNEILGNLGNVADGTQEELDQIRGEALALRAFAHFDLVRMHARPYGEGRNNPGVPYVFEPTNPQLEPVRNTVGEVYDFILADLQEARSLISFVNNARFSPLAIDAFMARVYLHMEDWQQAEAMASAAINNGPALSDVATYTNMFSQDVDGEVILKAAMTTDNGAIGSIWFSPVTNQNQFAPSEDLMSLYGSGDVRGQIFFASGISTSTDPFSIVKYPGRPAEGQFGLNDIKHIRQSEMYLIRAEARAELGNGANALSDLNAVRSARGAGTGSEQGQALVDAIKTERRKELCFEGHRWFDILRWGDDLVRNDCNAGECTLSATDFRRQVPIPQAEVDANDNMVQNPGYE